MLRSLILSICGLFLMVTAPANAQTAETSRDSLISFAHDYLKTPYRRGGSTPKAFDCSGFSSYVYKHFGYNLFRSSCDQAKNGIEVSKEDLKPGDLVLFKGRNSKADRVGHVGIVIEAENGEFKFIHASVKYGVTINSGEQPYYKSRFVTARRIIHDDDLENEEQYIPLFPLEGKPIEIKIFHPDNT